VITDNDIKRQNIGNLERSILIHILNKSPVEKLQEIRDKIIKLKNEINREETEYYCAFKIKTPIEVTYMDGVTLHGRLRLLKSYKKKGEKKLKILILKNVKTGKHCQVPMNDRYSFKTTKDPEVGDRVFKVDREDISKVNECVVVKILEYNKDRKKKKPNQAIMKKDRPIHLILENVSTKMKIHYVTPYKEGRDYKVGDDILYNYQPWKVIKIIQHKGKKEKLDPFIEKRRPKGVVFSEFANMPLNWVVPKHIRRLLKGIEKPNIVFSYHRKAGKNIAYEIMKAKEEQAKRVEKMVLARKLKEFHRKPYLSVTLEEVKGKKQGKENLEKIEFPCYCSYWCNGHRWKGQINRDFDYYYLISMNTQKDYNVISKRINLETIMDEWDIEILKAEVKLWKEVGEYTK